MQLQKNSFRTDLVLAAVLVTSLLTIALFLVTYAIQRVTIPWYSASRKHATTA
jgi:ABC-type nitrate/sulfonate/bicarbonate transport system permease component